MYMYAYTTHTTTERAVERPVPHAGVTQTLDEGNVGLEILNLTLDLLRHGQAARNVVEVLHTLVHGLEGIADIGSQQLGVNADQRIIHPCVVPLQPTGRHYPQVLVGLKVPNQLPNLTEGESYVHCWILNPVSDHH